ncbi:MAG: hypothetical protein LBC58_01930 [Clostridiales Family XIII bacterium]|jgi:hypothetical protein|nr:hypothetical protein [Clostridiales Family XIII bacterium]
MKHIQHQNKIFPLCLAALLFLLSLAFSACEKEREPMKPNPADAGLAAGEEQPEQTGIGFDKLDGVWFNVTDHEVVKLDAEHERYWVAKQPDYAKKGNKAFVYAYKVKLDEKAQTFTLKEKTDDIIYHYELSEDGNVFTVSVNDEDWSNVTFYRAGSAEAEEYKAGNPNLNPK